MMLRPQHGNLRQVFRLFTSHPRLWLNEVVLTSTHNLCFRAKIRRTGIALYVPEYYLLGVKIHKQYRIPLLERDLGEYLTSV